MEFDSLNPYQSLQVIVEDDPEALVKSLKKIVTPIKIVSIVPFGNKQAAYIIGDIRPEQMKKIKKEKK